MKTNVKWAALSVALLIVSFTAMQLLRQPVMTEDDIDVRIEEIYGGIIRNIVHDGDEVIVAFTREKSMYEVTMDTRTGTFSDLEIIFEDLAEQTADEDASIDTQPASGETTMLTPEDANTIAISKYFGTVQTNRFIEDENASYYEIEIASTTQRYTIHVAAQTGEIILVRIDS